MKHYLKFSFFFLLLISASSCDRDELAVRNNSISFLIEHISNSEGCASSDDVPAAIFFSIEDRQGNSIQENKKLPLLTFGQGFISESLLLPVGNYSLTKFMVLNGSNKIMYAAPLEGSPKSNLVTDALPIHFTVSGFSTTQVKPEVLAVSSHDQPESFGYSSFGFDVVGDPETIDIRFQVELKVGDIIYQNIDTEILITGYDANHDGKWTKQFSYTGPSANDFPVRTGFHHYTVKMHKWGVTDEQTILAGHLWEGRADGPAPVTYVLGGETAPKKLAYYINFFEMENGSMVPQHKTEYAYDGYGKLTRIQSYSYHAATEEFTSERYAEFIYDGNHVAKISHFLMGSGQLYIEDVYEYLPNGNVSRITEKNYGTGITSRVNLTYNYTDRIVNAAYTNSNGTGFQYEFFYSWKNIITDKTMRGAEICSEGVYTYDKNINPLKHLGYVDFLLFNYSINNRLTENVQYKACGFLELIPESFQYQYDSEGYPVTATTFYKTSGGRQLKAENRFYY